MGVSFYFNLFLCEHVKIELIQNAMVLKTSSLYTVIILNLHTHRKRPRFISTLMEDHDSKYLGNRRDDQKDATKSAQDKLQGMMKELSGKEVGVYHHVIVM